MTKARSHVAARLVSGVALAFIITTPIFGVSQPYLGRVQAEESCGARGSYRPPNLLAGTWRDELRLLLVTAIAVMEGTGGTTTLDPADDAEFWMSTLADVYADEGIRPDMTDQEKGDLLDAIDDADLHLDSAPSSVDTGAVSDCETLLDDMRTELLGASL